MPPRAGAWDSASSTTLRSRPSTLKKKHGIGKVLIADWDVHHGNGTQDTFYRDGSVFFFSTHQSPWYPGTGDTWETGEGSGRGTTLNAPFPAGAGRVEIVGTFRKRLVALAKEFKPDLVLISAGFDSRMGDPLGKFTLDDQDFSDLNGHHAGDRRAARGGKIGVGSRGGIQLDWSGSSRGQSRQGAGAELTEAVKLRDGANIDNR